MHIKSFYNHSNTLYFKTTNYEKLNIFNPESFKNFDNYFHFARYLQS